MTEPCHYEHRISSLEKKDETLFGILKNMEDKFDSKLDLILFQINKIAVLEANHTNHAASMQRAFQKIENLEGENRKLNTFKDRTEGMAKMAWLLWGSVGGLVGFLLIKVFFGSN
jgi:hypothetical protein